MTNNIKQQILNKNIYFRFICVIKSAILLWN